MGCELIKVVNFYKYLAVMRQFLIHLYENTFL